MVARGGFFPSCIYGVFPALHTGNWQHDNGDQSPGESGGRVGTAVILIINFGVYGIGKSKRNTNNSIASHFVLVIGATTSFCGDSPAAGARRWWYGSLLARALLCGSRTRGGGRQADEKLTQITVLLKIYPSKRCVNERIVEEKWIPTRDIALAVR